jgi:glutamate-ammonia-ligase adenylyltransferase
VEEQIADGRKAGLIGADEGDALARAWRLLWRLQASARLLTDRPLDMEGVGEGGRAFLLRETGARDLDDLARMTEEGASAAAAVIAAGLGAAPGGEGGDAG